MKSLIVTKAVEKIKFEMYCGELEASWRKTLSRGNHGQTIQEKVQVSCEIARYGKTLIYIFHQFPVSIKRIVRLEGKMGTWL